MTDPLDIDAFAAQLRTYDIDRYLTARLAPKSFRPALTILCTFNSELSRICDTVSEPALGEIRLQWWRDMLANEDQSHRTGAPLADAVMQTVASYDLPRPLLLGLIDARSADLDGGGFADLQALKAYLYKIDGALFALSAHVLGSTGGQVAKAANAAGVAYGLTRLLRDLPRDATAGRVMLPLNLLKRCDVLPEQLLAGQEGEGLRDLMSELAGEARAALDEARTQLGMEPKALRATFAPLALVPSYLGAVTRPGRQHLYEIADINPLRRFLLLWRAARLGRL